MKNQPDILITIQSDSAEYQITNPRKYIIKNDFGAEPHRAWLEIYNKDITVPIQLGDELNVFIDDKLCFQGKITQRRIDSIDDYITYIAEWEPRNAYNLDINQRFENKSIAEILKSITSDAGLSLDSTSLALINDTATLPVTLEFASKNLFSCIDLLAKLAGNWLWDVTLDRELRFRPANNPIDQHVHLQLDHYVINLRQNEQQQYSHLIIEGGLNGSEPIEISLESEQPSNSQNRLKVVARSIVTLEGLAQLAHAVKQQLLQPNYYHYVDLNQQGWDIQAGETIQFTVVDYPIFPEHNFFRVVQRELTYAHEQITTRLYLTSGFESTHDYFEHQNTELSLPAYLIGRVGPFQLDVSALDTPAHLDGVT